MIVSIVTFAYPDGVDADDFVRTCTERRHRYEGLDGLHQKLYWVADDRMTAGGIYVWESRAAAERVYTPAWRATAAEVFGAQPEIRFSDVTDVIANQPVS